MPTLADFAIVTSRSRIASFQNCPRLGYWSWLAPNSAGTLGWERRRLALPLATGIYVHKGPEHIFKNGIGSVDDAVRLAVDAYRAEASTRGLDSELPDDMTYVIDEQAALIEALIRAWARIRFPLLMDDYDVVSVEQEELADLGSGVGLQARTDAILRRKADARLFIWNAKTVSDAGDRWQRSWEVDMQLMTEVLAVEQRTGEPCAGVLIEGFLKGKRMPEKASDGTVTRYRQTSPLIYGYKLDANPPVQKADYTWEYTRARGWHRFPVWQEMFDAVNPSYLDLPMPGDLERIRSGPVGYWVNWLPEEVVASQFVPLPPILRNAEAIESVKRQIVAATQRYDESAFAVAHEVAAGGEPLPIIDHNFPQNFHSCEWPTRCQMYDACHSPGVRDALLKLDGSGIYVPRVSHHPTNGGSE